MKTLLFLNHSRSLHGAEQVLLRSMAVAQRAGYRCLMVLPSIVREEGLRAKVAQLIGEEAIYELPYRAYGYGRVRTLLVRLYNSWALWRLCRIVRAERVETIYSNTSITCIGIQAARRMHTRHIWHLHEPVDARYGWTPSNRRWYKMLMTDCHNECIFISNRQREEWENTIGCMLPGRVVYNPIKMLPSVTRQTSEVTRYGYIGSFEARKNVSQVVKAFEQVRAQMGMVSLTLCGAGNDEELRRYQGDGIRVMRHTDDVASYYANVDVLLLPSFSETMPLVVIEAMQAGVATIQTTESGMSELFHDGVDTYFVHPDDAQGWVKKMLLLTDKTRRQTMADMGRQTVCDGRYNERYEQLITELLCA